ncbi:alkaline phosphatase family protein [Falsiroseomonas selenitidurans]|uniref:Alkaline phosphatase family protein n=1 Tax=Falsiroseomonas selenitidurans TaxID=2716335 RepID=A0ABX1E9K4_9PROT|nr:alkaline phosphatase family protein [Falsiroseomonas selenitidurans]NKC32468.1 alkaline phosphatase family protein [Falsiroseomonas selenitidurans]
MAERAILLLIDGLPADVFAAEAARLRNLSALAARGLHLARVTPAQPSVSFPGRAEMLTGRGPAENGVWGNAIHDGTRFRKAMADDIRVPTLARAVRDAGGTVASIGFGLVDPADADWHSDPWWQHLDAADPANTKGPAAAPLHIRRDADGLLAAALRRGAFTFGPGATPHGLVQPQMLGFACDMAQIDAAAALLCGEAPPRLVLTEIATPDAALHYHGLGSAAADLAIALADMLVGRLVQHLEAAGRLHDTLIVVSSDHGHAPIDTALYPEAILPGKIWASEGGALHVLAATARDVATLAALGITPLPDTHLPEAQRGRITTFVAPAGQAFERRTDVATPTGAPIVVATHGNAPGTPGDDAVAFLAGGGMPRGLVPRASLRDLAPAILHLLGLPALAGTRPNLIRERIPA